MARTFFSLFFRSPKKWRAFRSRWSTWTEDRTLWGAERAAELFPAFRGRTFLIGFGSAIRGDGYDEWWTRVCGRERRRGAERRGRPVAVSVGSEIFAGCL